MDPTQPQNRQLKRMQAAEDRRAEKAATKGGGKPQRSRPQAPRERVGSRQFLREVNAEMRKVLWPTRQQVVNSFFVVLTTVVIMTTLIFVLDWAFEYLIKWIYQ